MLAGPAFGLTLIAFYYSSSKLTKFKAHIKQHLEEDFKEGGQRTPAQARLTPRLVYFWIRFNRRSCACSYIADWHVHALIDGGLGLDGLQVKNVMPCCTLPRDTQQLFSVVQVLANSLGSAVFAALAAAAAFKLIPQIIPQPALLAGFLVRASRGTCFCPSCSSFTPPPPPPPTGPLLSCQHGSKSLSSPGWKVSVCRHTWHAAVLTPGPANWAFCPGPTPGW